ncbi:MAG: hypothetical protein ACK5Z0_01505, partial [Planctomycetota bacterium]
MTTPTTADSTPNRRNEHPARRWMLRVVACVVALPLLFWGVSYAWQNWFAASADPNLVHELK